jgi:uncharacterized membrane protein YeaQ/YmgE (transglycosylase-associated protein family)
MSATYGVLIAAAIGLVTGWLANQMTSRRHGLLSTLAVGLVGSFLGAFIADVIDVQTLGVWSSAAISAVGAIGLLVFLALVRRRV